jgi:GT2 family glycosyltransferase
MEDHRIGVVIITYQRRDEALGAVERLTGLPEQPPIVLVDNGSTDGTADAVRERFPQVDVLALDWNAGAVGRNLGVRRLATPYVAFCDDDTWWQPGSLAAAADALDAFPGLAIVNARIVVEPSGREDPIVAELRDSPVPGPDWLPGPALGSFLAGAAVVRRKAFESVGGFSPRLWLGGEEERSPRVRSTRRTCSRSRAWTPSSASWSRRSRRCIGHRASRSATSTSRSSCGRCCAR